jgi:hypothetical protein
MSRTVRAAWHLSRPPKLLGWGEGAPPVKPLGEGVHPL